jgi:hypothetical protein
VSTCEGESPRETTSITATFSRLCADFCNPRPGNVRPKVQFAVDSPLEARDRSGARMALVDRDNPHKDVRFAGDSLLEGDGFEPSVPRKRDPLADTRGKGTNSLRILTRNFSPPYAESNRAIREIFALIRERGLRLAFCPQSGALRTAALIAALGPYPSTPLAETPRPSRRR